MITESDGSPVNMSPASYGNTNKESKTLLIKYQEDGISKQENYPIEIINDVKQIAIQGTAQSQYNVNDPLQTGLSILVTRASGVPEAITVTSNMLTNFSTATEGKKNSNNNIYRKWNNKNNNIYIHSNRHSNKHKCKHTTNKSY